jgi:hypothetical protein
MVEELIVGKAQKVVKAQCISRREFSPADSILARIRPSEMLHKVRSATLPLDIVSFLLTPQGHRRRIPATFSVGFRSRGSERLRGNGSPPTAGRECSPRTEKIARHSRGGKSVQYLPGWTVQCINPECAARGHWLRASDSGGELCSNCSAPLHNVPPPISPRLRMRPRSLGSYRPPGRSRGRQR